VPRQDVLGPLTPPPLAPDLPHLSPGQLADLAARLLTTSQATGHLPASLAAGERAVGLGSLYGALAEAYLALAGESQPAAGRAIRLDAWPRYPAQAVALGERLRRCAEDPLVRPGLSTELAVGQMQAHTWTLKPAPRR
jgi:hypothetical protein